MTTGEKLLSIWRDFITLEQEKAAAIDAAIAAAVEKRTVEILDAIIRKCVVTHNEKGNLYRQQEVEEIILALNTPAPAYPFGLDASGKQCKHWTLRDDGSWLHYLQREPLAYHHLDASFTHCPFCGAPRTKGV